tara:strand:- start:809 stop:1414 length:606 start_codon:yes stop_codon:yes gene_type:complete
MDDNNQEFSSIDIHTQLLHDTNKSKESMQQNNQATTHNVEPVNESQAEQNVTNQQVQTRENMQNEQNEELEFGGFKDAKSRDEYNNMVLNSIRSACNTVMGNELKNKANSNLKLTNHKYYKKNKFKDKFLKQYYYVMNSRQLKANISDGKTVEKFVIDFNMGMTTDKNEKIIDPQILYDKSQEFADALDDYSNNKAEFFFG